MSFKPDCDCWMLERRKAFRRSDDKGKDYPQEDYFPVFYFRVGFSTNRWDSDWAFCSVCGKPAKEVE